MENVLFEKRKDVLNKAELIVVLAEKEERGMTPEETAQCEAFTTEAARLEGEIEGLHRAKVARDVLDAAKRYDVPTVVRKTLPVDDAQAPRIEVSENPHSAYQKGDAFGAVVAARFRDGQNIQTSINYARKAYGESSPQCRALQQTVFTAGGALIPENFVGREFIELLTPQSPFRSAGARVVPFVNGSITVPKMLTGSTHVWLGAEGDNITASEPTLGQVKLTEKKSAVLVPFSNDLKRNASLEMERLIRDDMVTQSAIAEDLAFLKGTGLAGQPKGIFSWIPAAGFTATAGATLANVRTDIRVSKNRLDTNNAPNSKRAWFMHSRAMNYMGWDLVDGNGNFAFPSMQNSGGASVGGDPVYRDNNISITLVATNTEIYYVEMTDAIIGDSPRIEVEVFENAAYVDSGGNLRSGISRDESVIRLIRFVDFALRHDVSAHVLTGVTYGA